jgi:ABC-type multidrug transport system ATPase subunit
MQPIIAQDVFRRHPNGRGVNGVSLSVEAGKCLGVLGANGSGKTTLTRLVAGLDRIDQGTLSVLGAPACPRPAHLRRRCGVALDKPAHWETLSGRQNLYFFAKQYGLSTSAIGERVEALLSQADLTSQADEAVSVYSFGMRRKLTIIEATAHDPDLLILDEPSAGIDVAFMDRLVQLVRDRCERGKTTWVADNDADWLARAATDVVLLSEGEIEARGAVAELMASVGARNRVEVLLEKPGFSTTPTIKGVQEFRCEKNCVTADVDGDPELPVKLLAWINASGGRVRSMEIHSITLHEALKKRAAEQEAKP